MLNERGVEFHSLTETINAERTTDLSRFLPPSPSLNGILRQRVNAGLASARRRGRVGGGPKALDGRI